MKQVLAVVVSFLSKILFKRLAVLVMGPGQNILTLVGSIFCGSGLVSHLWFGFEFQKFPQKTSNFSIFFTFGSKKISFGRVGKYPGQSQVSLLFSAGQKLGSGQGPSLGCISWWSWWYSLLYYFNLTQWFWSRDGPWPNPSILLICSKKEADPPSTRVFLRGIKLKIFMFLRDIFQPQIINGWPDQTQPGSKIF